MGPLLGLFPGRSPPLGPDAPVGERGEEKTTPARCASGHLPLAKCVGRAARFAFGPGQTVKRTLPRLVAFSHDPVVVGGGEKRRRARTTTARADDRDDAALSRAGGASGVTAEAAWPLGHLPKGWHPRGVDGFLVPETVIIFAPLVADQVVRGATRFFRRVESGNGTGKLAPGTIEHVYSAHGADTN